VIPLESYLLLAKHGNGIYGPFIVYTLLNSLVEKSNSLTSVVVEVAG
jgi:hypothetical protein